MSMNPLPPQAYTKDALQKAYAWLMNQPASIRELATTPDVLVSLYLKTQRDGMESLERPSIQNFRSELKQLAGMMSEFSEHENITTMPSIQTQHHAQAPNQAFNPLNFNQTIVAKNSAPESMPTRQQTASAQMIQPSAPAATLDSQKMIQEVKERLGFSSDHQALEALIRVGYHHLISRIFKT